MIDTGWTHTWTTTPKGSENGYHGPPLTLISIVKRKRGVGSHVEKGWDPPRPTEPDLGLT